MCHNIFITLLVPQHETRNNETINKIWDNKNMANTRVDPVSFTETFFCMAQDGEP